MLKYRSQITQISGLLLSLGVAATALLDDYFSLSTSRELLPWLLSPFLLLYLAQPWLSRRLPGYLPFYLLLQATIVATLLFIPPLLDSFAVLFIAILLQITPALSSRDSFLTVGAFACLAAASFIVDEGLPSALGQIFVYSAAYLLVASFTIALHQLEAARARLETHLSQAEELAVVKERNRLARELHDSVTQTVFGMTFTAESARAMVGVDDARLRQHLDRLIALAESALAEMRSLIFELRPLNKAAGGLLPALREHVAALQQQHGLAVDLSVEGEERLAPEQAHPLFRTAQEALNNILKHAHTERASIQLQFGADRSLMTISDGGRGFDSAAQVNAAIHMGLQNMQERIRAIDGTLTVQSEPGAGTRVIVSVAHQGVQRDG